MPAGRPAPPDLVYVDLDGTLTPSDSLAESVVALIRARPMTLLRLPVWLLGGRSFFKEKVANAVSLDPAVLPYRDDLVIDLRSWRDSGTELVLATAAHSDIAMAVSDHLGVFDSVLASDSTTNLKGLDKLAAIQDHARGRPFAYVGNGIIDLPILEAAETAFVAGPRAVELGRLLSEEGPVGIYDEHRRRSAAVVQLIRPRQWLKNLLVFVPLVTAQQLADSTALSAAVAAFAALSLAASGSYVLNDILDVHADRRHHTKARRPIAAGQVPIPVALALSLVLVIAGFGVAFLLPEGFRVALAAYVGISLAYTLHLKRLLLLDVVTLASLFVLRVVAGAEAIEVTTSFWLLAFSLFFFASLALAKRCSELHNLEEGSGLVPHGRAYRAGDLAVLQSIGAASGVISVLVLALYIEDPASEAVYGQPDILWLLSPLLLYWVSRFWIKVGRGELDEDPLLFSLTDAASWGVMALGVTVILLAT